MYGYLTQCANPFLVLMVLMGVAIAWCWRQPAIMQRRRLWVLTALYVMLFTFCLPVTAWLLSGTLEWAFPPLLSRPDLAQGIVVLGGGIQSPALPGGATEIGESSLWRCIKAAELHADGEACPLFVIGGNPDSMPGEAVARVMSRTLVKLGIPQAQLVVEDQSRDTYENANATATLLNERGIKVIVLVTSATHLRRAVHLFRARGFEVIPAGCDYEDAPDRDLFSLLPSIQAAETSQQVTREWLATVKLWMQGRW
jgi:uncharacterized SAM-binding protein YcdF (DUF218 family)